jgi:hypothetical protein
MRVCRWAHWGRLGWPRSHGGVLLGCSRVNGPAGVGATGRQAVARDEVLACSAVLVVSFSDGSG